MTSQSSPSLRIRWWPAVLVIAGIVVWIAFVRSNDNVAFQQRNIATARAALVGALLLLIWWSFCSRAPKRLRQATTLAVFGTLLCTIALFRIRGVSGDLVPILEPRWVKRVLPEVAVALTGEHTPVSLANTAGEFPQFLGPDRTGVLPETKLAQDWTARPPAVLWRQAVGAAWSGFSIVGGRAFTQEQRGTNECVSCYDLATGKLLWLHADNARYFTTIAGEGPRATPTVMEGRVFTLGGTGLLNCLEASTGLVLWQRHIVKDANSSVPDWGFAGSPLVVDGRVIVSAGGSRNKSLLAYTITDGELVWGGGTAAASYGSPFLATLAGARQILAFNSLEITAHDAGTGAVLWEHPWGEGNPSVAAPVVVGPDRVLFTSGYGVGAELIEVGRDERGRLTATTVWHSIRMKAKFSNCVARDGYLYGLDDGILTCVDLQDGSQRWKEGRYGHGQGLLVGEHYLLMTENGELVLLRPTPDAPNELARFHVFKAKTWNPIALVGDLLLVRNDQEAACLRLPLLKVR